MQIAMITGAGSGIGRATALALGSSGYALALVGRRRGPLEETAERIEGAPAVVIIEADVSVNSEAQRAVRAAVEGLIDDEAEGGDSGGVAGLDALVNNAGAAEVIRLDAMDGQAWARMMAGNADTAGFCTIAAWPHLKARKGTIINVASMAALDPLEGFSAYGAAKAAVGLLTAACAKEGRRHGVRAFSLCPGAVETPMLRGSFSEATVPKAATLTPEAVAGVVLACLRGERDASNGKSLPVLPRSFEKPWKTWAGANPTGWIGMEPVFG